MTHNGHQKLPTLNETLDQLENEIDHTVQTVKWSFTIGFLCGAVVSGIITWVILT